MKTFLTLVLGLLLVGASHAQFVVYQGGQGTFVLLSKNERQAFSLEIHGDKSIRPIGEKDAPHPYFLVDGRFLQVMPVPLSDFKGDEKDDDLTLLQQHLRYEADFHKLAKDAVRVDAQKLPGGQSVLLWSFVPRQTDKEQVFVSFRHKGYLLVLGSAVDAGDTTAAVHKFLLQTAATFHAYEKPVTLEFSQDGSYKPK
jgi:hypothetical protein